MIIQDNFRNCWERLKRIGPKGFDAILLDLGVSSLQLDNVERGFSFRGEGPLDMRMDPAQSVSAETLINEMPEKDLLETLWKLGEERFARRIVASILRERRIGRIRSTSQLEAIIFHSVPKTYRYGRIHPATRTFQAIRMAVNQELESLQAFLSEAPSHLNPGGRIAVISFHSLEDRLVKLSFRELVKNNIGKSLTKKPLQPGQVEISRNPRSRSAKMRVFEIPPQEEGQS